MVLVLFRKIRMFIHVYVCVCEGNTFIDRVGDNVVAPSMVEGIQSTLAKTKGPLFLFLIPPLKSNFTTFA